MAEWSKAAVLKTVEGASPPGVRIPISPPDNYEKSFYKDFFIFMDNEITNR